MSHSPLPRGACPEQIERARKDQQKNDAENDFIVGYLSSRLDPIPVAENDLLGVSAAQKEAVLMAVLANEFAMSNPANIPRATGAERAVVLGALYLTL